MSALFDFKSFITVVLLTICTCTYVKMRAPQLMARRPTPSIIFVAKTSSFSLVWHIFLIMLISLVATRTRTAQDSGGCSGKRQGMPPSCFSFIAMGSLLPCLRLTFSCSGTDAWHVSPQDRGEAEPICRLRVLLYGHQHPSILIAGKAFEEMAPHGPLLWERVAVAWWVDDSSTTPLMVVVAVPIAPRRAADRRCRERRNSATAQRPHAH